jgi:methanol--5-hydroxybenzimidazolylcobamide Co-methyltransferase
MLWEKITGVAKKHGKIAAGDTACGFGNTAMVMAEKGFIPRVFAAVARVITVVRTLVAIEEGATGPDKDCGYEGPFLKAITGTPISMEGKSATCAHFSPMGNVAGACADLWSNESVQNIKLLSGFAPTVYMEQLEYDSRLFNQAIKMGDGHVHMLQDMLVESDVHFDPQAFILSPSNVITISEEIVKGKTYIEAAVNGALKALDIIEEAHKAGELKIPEIEIPWIANIRSDLEDIPSGESEFIEMMLPRLDSSKIILSEYGM